MFAVLIQHKIGAWSEFEAVFREDAERRRRLGSKGGRVFRDLDDPSNVFVIFEWDSADNALQFAGGLETHEAMKWASSGIWSQVDAAEQVFEVDA